MATVNYVEFNFLVKRGDTYKISRGGSLENYTELNILDLQD